MFKIPVKEIIVNDDAQVRVLEGDGTTYATGVPSGSKFRLEGFSDYIATTDLVVQSGTTRIMKQLAVAATGQTTTVTIPDGTYGAAGKETIYTLRAIWDSLDKTPTEFQNIPLEKIIQIVYTGAKTESQLASEIVSQFNSSKIKAPLPISATVSDSSESVFEVASLQITAASTASGNVTVTLDGVATTVAIGVESAISVAGKIRDTAFAGWTTGGSGDTVTFTSDTIGNRADASYSAGATGAAGTMTTTTQGSTSVITFTSTVGVSFEVFFSVAPYADGTVANNIPNSAKAITVAATLPLNTYEFLKNKEWSRNFDLDRNAEYFPVRGKNYTSFYFEANFSASIAGGYAVPSQLNADGKTGYRVYAIEGSALETALDALATAVNV